jgi:pyridinium-3,5-biscarboxylic acid mononucleotide sulfurtransferase
MILPERKYQRLRDYLKKLKKVVIAFSGGVDSTFLLITAHNALGENVLAITVDSPYIPRRELKEAKDLARKFNIRHQIIKLPLSESIIENPENRCYYCKSSFFSGITEKAHQKGFEHILEGTNRDDHADYRPGSRALRESGILSPLKICGMSKKDIRSLSRKLQLPTWDKPSDSCLLTRIPYNTKITLDELKRIESSEHYLAGIGFSGARVRSHGDLARIEVSRDQRAVISDERVMDSVSIHLKDYGYTYVCFDLEGYRMGSFNPKKGRQ